MDLLGDNVRAIYRKYFLAALVCLETLQPVPQPRVT